MKNDDFLNDREVETKKLSELTKKIFVPLSANVLDKKPAEGKWNIAECFHHLNLTLEFYVSQMLEVIKQKEKYPSKGGYKPGLMGRLGVKAMQPKSGEKISYKMKTFRVLNPELTKPDEDSIKKFLQHQDNILIVIAGLRGMSLTKPKIKTMAGPLFKMSIGDALHFMIAHNQRHILQAQKVLEIIH